MYDYYEIYSYFNSYYSCYYCYYYYYNNNYYYYYHQSVVVVVVVHYVTVYIIVYQNQWKQNFYFVHGPVKMNMNITQKDALKLILSL